MTSPLRRRLLNPKLLNWLRILLTLLTFAAVGWYINSRPTLNVSSLTLRWEFLAYAAACLPPFLFLRAYKWKVLLRGVAPEITLGQALRSYLGAMALGLVTPGRVGEFSRGLYLPYRAVQGWRGAGLVLIDNWIDFLAVLAWACLGWFMWFGWKGLALGVFLTLAFAPISGCLKVMASVAHKLPSRWGFRNSAQKSLAAQEGVSKQDYFAATGASILAYGIEWVQIALLIGFLMPVIPEPWRLAGIMALVTLVNSVQITLAGLGIREGVSMIFLAKEGVGGEAAVAAAFLQSVFILFIPALAGLAIKPIALTEPE